MRRLPESTGRVTLTTSVTNGDLRIYSGPEVATWEVIPMPTPGDPGRMGKPEVETKWTCEATMTLPERADYSLTESALSPFPAEPAQFGI